MSEGAVIRALMVLLMSGCLIAPSTSLAAEVSTVLAAPGSNIAHFAVATSPEGHAAVEWNSNEESGVDSLVSARRGPSSGWTQTAYSPRADESIADSDVAMDEDGNSLAAFLVVDKSAMRLMSIYTPVDGVPQPPEVIAAALRDDQDRRRIEIADVEFSDTSRASVVWSDNPDGCTEFYAADRGSQGWEPTEVPGPDPSCNSSVVHPVLAAGPAGRFVLAWGEGDGSGRDLAVRAVVRAGSAWGQPVTLDSAAGRHPASPHVYVRFDRLGNSFLAWGSDGTMRSAVNAVDGTWGTPSDVPGSRVLEDGDGWDFGLGVAGDEAFVAWRDPYERNASRVATRRAGGGWTPARTVGREGPTGTATRAITVAGNEAGDALILYSTNSTPMQLVFRRAGEDWRPSVPVPGLSAQLLAVAAFDIGARATVAFQPDFGSRNGLKAMTIDDTYTGPPLRLRVRAVQVERSGRVSFTCQTNVPRTCAGELTVARRVAKRLHLGGAGTGRVLVGAGRSVLRWPRAPDYSSTVRIAVPRPTARALSSLRQRISAQLKIRARTPSGDRRTVRRRVILGE